MKSRKGVAFALIFQNVFAYCLTLMVYQFGGLITGELSFGLGTAAAVIVLIVFLYLLFRPDPNKKRTADTVPMGAEA